MRRKRYEAPAFQSRHPGLNEYIGTTCNAIMHELQHVRRPLTQASLRQVVVALVDEDAPNADDVLERYVFALDFLLPDTDVRNRDLLYVGSLRRIKGNLSQAAAELVARQFLLQLLTLEARLPPAGERRTSPNSRSVHVPRAYRDGRRPDTDGELGPGALDRPLGARGWRPISCEWCGRRSRDARCTASISTHLCAAATSTTGARIGCH